MKKLIYFVASILLFASCSPKNQSFRPTQEVVVANVQSTENDATAGQIVPISVHKSLNSAWKNNDKQSATASVVTADAPVKATASTAPKMTSEQKKAAKTSFYSLPKDQQKALIKKASKSKDNLKPGKTIGILSMVFGAVGWLVPYIGILLVIGAIVLGIIGLKTEGRTFAIIGLVLSVITMLLLLLLIGLVVGAAIKA